MARVLIHTLVFAPDGVSTAYIMTDLALELSRRGHQVTVLTTTPHYNVEASATAAYALTPVASGLFRGNVGDVAVWHLTMPMKGKKMATRMVDYVKFHLRSLWVAARRLGPFDVVLAPSPPLTIGIIAAIIGKAKGAPSIYNLQEIFPDAAINDGMIKNPAMIGLMRLVERSVYRANTRVVAISRAFADLLRDREVPAEKIVVIPNFVDTTLYMPGERQNDFAREHRLTDFVVLYAGNIGATQDWDSLLHAATVLRDTPITFALSGDGGRGEWLRGEVASRQLSNVRFLGYLPREHTPLVYASSDLGIIPMKPGTTTDTFPSKVYTHLACGKPVIVSADDGSELKRIVEESQCGQVVEPGNADALTRGIRRAFERRESLVQDGRRGRAYVERTYSKEAVGFQYSELITALARA